MPIRFSCVHAHVMNKMANVAPLQREIEKQLSQVLLRVASRNPVSSSIDDVERLVLELELHSLPEAFDFFFYLGC